MTAQNFPNSPSNGDTKVVGNITYTYNSTKGYWDAAPSVGSTIQLSSLSVGSPASASSGGSLAYSSGTGVFTFTPPDLSSFITAAGAGVSLSTMNTALALKSDLSSPTFTGAPLAPTPSTGTNTTQIATTAFVNAEVAALVASAPATLNTLNELATAIGDDANFSTTITNSIAAKAPLADPTFTGIPAAATASAGTNTTQLATTAFVTGALGSYSTTLGGLTDVSTSGATTGQLLSYNGTSWAPAAAPTDFFNVVATVAGGKFVIDGASQQILAIIKSGTYRFDQSDSTNASHPLKFSTYADGTHGGGSEYTNGITYNGTPGSAGAYTQITLEQDTPSTMYYYCANHSAMGNSAIVGPTSGGGGGGGGASVSVTETPPGSPSNGDLWFDSSNLKTYVYYNDGSSAQWVLTNPAASNTVTTINDLTDVSSTSPTSGQTLSYNGTAWAPSNATDLTAYATSASVTSGLSAKAPLADPTFTGVPAAPTASQGANSTQLATTSYVDTGIANLVNGAPGTLDTLNEIATALNNDAALNTTLTTAIGLKASIDAPTFTGVPAAPTAAAATDTTQIATTAFVTGAVATKADLAGPTFTGTPIAPTAYIGTNTTQIATTAFVQAATPDTLNDLTDVSISGASNGQTLSFNGSAWAPATPTVYSTTLNGLTDVSSAGASSGQVLSWSGSTWAPAAAIGRAAVYANPAALPTSGNADGDIAYTRSNTSIHIWDNNATAWKSVALT